MYFMKPKPSSTSFPAFFLRVQTVLMVAILALPVHPIHAQDKENDWKSDKLIGRVQSVTDTVFRTIEVFGAVARDREDYEVINVYNNEGYLESIDFKNPNKLTKSRTLFTYKKNLLTEARYEDDGKLTAQKYLYDANDRLIEMNFYDRDGKLIRKQKNKYDSKGRLLLCEFYRGDGSLSTSEEYRYKTGTEGFWWKIKINKLTNIEEHWACEYDAKGQLKSEKYLEAGTRELKQPVKVGDLDIFTVSPDKKQVTEKEFRYNDKGLLVEEATSYWSRGGSAKERSKKFEYDKYGNVTLEKTSETFYVTHTYTYDTTGNWTQHIESYFTPDNNFHFITARSIKYY
jgi:hypothetical protein